jgi:tetracycline resistance efflux pump
MNAIILSFIPFLIIVCGTILFNELRYSLFAAIVITAFITHHDNFFDPLIAIFNNAYDFLMNKDTAFLYLFLICIPALITLLIETKAVQEFAAHFIARFQSKAKLSYAACLGSLFLSIDDYFSILAVGNLFRPLFDGIGIARAKLAFFIHALSGPVVIMLPLSSWVATITTFLHQSGVRTDQSIETLIFNDPFSIYLQSIPFILYSLLTIIGIFFIIKNDIAYGPMYIAEKKATPSFIFADHNKQQPQQGNGYGLIYCFLLLFAIILVGMLYQGDYWAFGGSLSFIAACNNQTSIFSILCIASLTTFILTFIYFIIRKKISYTDIPRIVFQGYLLMAPVLQMILLTSILSAFLKNDLKTGFYLAEYIQNGASIEYIPVGFFIISFLIAVSTGSSWATFGILLPVAIPIITTVSTGENISALLNPTLGALFSGALCGDHISPFSETTIMSAHAAMISPEEHTKTQLPYAIPVILGCLTGFFTFGFSLHYPSLVQYGISFLVSVLTTLGLLIIFNQKKTHHEA